MRWSSFFYNVFFLLWEPLLKVHHMLFSNGIIFSRRLPFHMRCLRIKIDRQEIVLNFNIFEKLELLLAYDRKKNGCMVSNSVLQLTIHYSLIPDKLGLHGPSTIITLLLPIQCDKKEYPWSDTHESHFFFLCHWTNLYITPLFKA